MHNPGMGEVFAWLRKGERKSAKMFDRERQGQRFKRKRVVLQFPGVATRRKERERGHY